MPSLLVVSGPREGDFFPLGPGAVVVGRDDSCQIQIVDQTISRRHLAVAFDDAADRYRVRDLDSANGVLLNGSRLDGADQPLRDGDVLRLGASELLFSEVDFTDSRAALDHHRVQGEADESTVLR